MDITSGKLLTIAESHAICDTGTRIVPRGTGLNRRSEYAGMSSQRTKLRKKYEGCTYLDHARMLTPQEIAAFRARIDALISGEDKPVRVFL